MYHSLDICQDIAKKLKNPGDVYQIIEEDIYKGRRTSGIWMDLSLVSGLPGIACFYAAMDSVFPDQRWDAVSHEYLKLAIAKCEKEGLADYSLFTGIAGLCFSAYSCSKQGTRYQNLLKKLDDHLVKKVESLIFELKVRQEVDYNFPHFYNLTQGLTGAVAYLLLRKDDGYLQNLAKDGVYTLIEMLKQKKHVDSAAVPGWYIPPSLHGMGFEKDKYPSGNFSLSIPFGITGCLSLLSLAAWEGIKHPALHQTIQEMASWLRQKQTQTPTGLSWPHTISFEEEINQLVPSQGFYREAWAYGTPAVASSLFLAGRALGDKSLKQFSEEAYVKLFSKKEEDWNLMGPSFGYGRAGLLATTYQMAKLTNAGFLMNKVAHLENELKSFYSPSHPFGFQVTDFTPEGERLWTNDPGLIDGTAGIALSLLLANGRAREVCWERIFLLN